MKTFKVKAEKGTVLFLDRYFQKTEWRVIMNDTAMVKLRAYFRWPGERTSQPRTIDVTRAQFNAWRNWRNVSQRLNDARVSKARADEGWGEAVSRSAIEEGWNPQIANLENEERKARDELTALLEPRHLSETFYSAEPAWREVEAS